MADITWGLPTGLQAAGSTQQTVTNLSSVTAVKELAENTSSGSPTATSSLSAAPRGHLRMSLVVRAASTPGGGPPPPGDGVSGSNVKIGSATFALASINPTDSTNPAGAGYPGSRGPNQLVLYQSPVTTTATNVYGVEISVNSSGVVTAVNDRQTNLSGTGTSVPSGGYVLSGHGTARAWLLVNATVGATVQLVAEVDPNPIPGGGGSSGGGTSGGLPTKMIAIYGKVWPGDSTNFGNYPSGANVLLPSFFQGTVPNMTGWGSIGKTAQLAALVARRAAGGKVVLSAGGGGAAINTSNRTQFVNQFDYWYQQYEGNVDGLDWDIENGSLQAADALWISTYLKNKYGQNFIIMMAPNGSVITQYIEMARQHNNAGVLDAIGPQTYADRGSGTPWTLAETKGRLSQILGAGIPQSKVSVGMNVGTSGAVWTWAQCRTYMADIRSTWPGITKAFLWVEPSYPMSELQQWVSDMQAVIG